MTTPKSPTPQTPSPPTPSSPPVPSLPEGIKLTGAPVTPPGAPVAPKLVLPKGRELGKGAFKRGKPLSGPITFYLRCPQCLHLQVEQMRMERTPSYLSCGACGKVIPTELWLMVAYHTLGGHVARMRDRRGRPAPGELVGV